MADFVIDTFTAADGTDLAAHSPGTGGAWSEDNALSATIQTGRVHGPFGYVVVAVNAATPPSANYHVTADVVLLASGGSYAGVCARWTGGISGTGYDLVFSVSDTKWYLESSVAGVKSTLGTFLDSSFTSGTRQCTLDCSGTTIIASIDGIPQITVTNSAVSAANFAGLAVAPAAADSPAIDNFIASDVTPPPPGTHVVSGRGNFSIAGLGWLSTSITGRPGHLTHGAAEPPNYYHVGMISWATTNGTMASYPVTRDLDLVQIPTGMSELFYEFVVGVTATIVELSGP